MPDDIHNTKRIAKNTVFLYFRMFIMMLIGLYTSRVILNVLGVKDYGTYNVVGGVVGMFSLLTTSMSSSISRFLTFELGKGDIECPIDNGRCYHCCHRAGWRLVP